MLNNKLKQRLKSIYESGNPLRADDIFSDLTVIPGISIRNGEVIEPLECLNKYKSLLEEIYLWNQEIYLFIHKGTPFYFCGIFSFYLGAYDSAFLYFDTAFSEDVKNKPEKDAFHWTNSAAYGFYRLDKNYGNVIVAIPVEKIRKLIDPLIEEFNIELGLNNKFKLDDLTSNFVVKKIKEKEYRSIIVGLYLFIVEGQQRIFQLKLRSDKGGTIEPYISHLSKGCLIFETLLRQIYSSHYSSEGMEKILNDPFIKRELEYCEKIPKNIQNKDLINYVSGVRKTLQDIIIHLLPNFKKDKIKDVNKWFTISYALRNVTTHNISWPDVFTADNYEELYKSVLFSIFYLIHRKF